MIAIIEDGPIPVEQTVCDHSTQNESMCAAEDRSAGNRTGDRRRTRARLGVRRHTGGNSHRYAQNDSTPVFNSHPHICTIDG